MVELIARCKLCQLLREDQDLWIAVHNRVLREGEAQSAVCTWLNARLETVNVNREEPIKPFNNANFSVHFSDHIKDTAMMVTTLGSALNGRKLVDEEQIKAQALLHAVTQEAADDYQRVKEMVGHLEANILAYSKTLEDRRNSAQGLSAKEIKNYNEFVSGYLDAKQSLTKLRSSDRLVADAVQKFRFLVAQGLASRVKKAAEEVRQFLEDNDVHGHLPEDIETMVKSKLSADMRQLFAEADVQVKKEFGFR